MAGERILHNVVSALTMTKITNNLMKNQNDALLLFGMYNNNIIDNTIKTIMLITLILTTKIEVADGTFFHVNQ